MLYLFTIAFFSDYDVSNRVASIDHGYTARGSDSGIQTFTVNNAIAPSNAKYVAIQIQAYNGRNVAFSSPMLTQTAQATGYQPDTGNVVSAGEIDGSVINGSTINGTTFNAGDVINDANNTLNFIQQQYLIMMVIFIQQGLPLTLCKQIYSGALISKYRAVIQHR